MAEPVGPCANVLSGGRGVFMTMLEFHIPVIDHHHVVKFSKGRSRSLSVHVEEAGGDI